MPAARAALRGQLHVCTGVAQPARIAAARGHRPPGRGPPAPRPRPPASGGCLPAPRRAPRRPARHRRATTAVVAVAAATRKVACVAHRRAGITRSSRPTRSPCRGPARRPGGRAGEHVGGDRCAVGRRTGVAGVVDDRGGRLRQVERLGPPPGPIGRLGLVRPHVNPGEQRVRPRCSPPLPPRRRRSAPPRRGEVGGGAGQVVGPDAHDPPTEVGVAGGGRLRRSARRAVIPLTAAPAGRRGRDRGTAAWPTSPSATRRPASGGPRSRSRRPPAGGGRAWRASAAGRANGGGRRPAPTSSAAPDSCPLTSGPGAPASPLVARSQASTSSAGPRGSPGQRRATEGVAARRCSGGPGDLGGQRPDRRRGRDQLGGGQGHEMLALVGSSPPAVERPRAAGGRPGRAPARPGRPAGARAVATRSRSGPPRRAGAPAPRRRR